MNAGTQNRNKTIAAGVLLTLASILLVRFIYTEFIESDGPTTPAIVATPSSSNTSATRDMLNNSSEGPVAAAASTGNRGLGAVPGVPAKRVASTSSSLDPTLNQSAMLRTESLVYAGTGRNIFSLIYTPPVAIPTNVPGVRKGPVATVPYTPPPPPVPCPPNCPPMPLKFFGTATRQGVRQAFILSGEDVYLASQGDIVARRYKVVTINANSVQMEDLTNHFTQTLPMSTQ
ncbi:hypothetical protein SAMN05421819_1389 [Bryocella elongata]|uniref:Uncharacterized protein n=1 Tax=Bryocella elongata TaxID=863522 RepID=A0A1H5W018_9BACT|nr:hypothetical protein [Bryocella elongata]SEF92859.1 hypothetical protein SAMN05421819_1389 [Bryocella elongata]